MSKPSLLLVAVVLAGSSSLAQPPETIPEIRRSYVPVGELEAILARRERGVLMSRDEFDQLLEAARANVDGAPRSSADLVVGAAEYTARLDGDRLRIDGRLGFRQLRDGWASTPLRLEGVAIESATVGNDPARIGRGEDGIRFLHQNAGEGTLGLELSAPVAEVGSDRVAAFRLPAPATATLAVSVPAGKRLLVDGAALPRPDAIDQPTTYAFPVGGEHGTRLTITDREANRSTDALLFAHAAVGLDVAPGEVGWRAVVSLNAFGQRLDTITFEVPASLEIAGVDSTGLESWQLDDVDAADPAQGTVVTLNYRRPFEGTRRVTLQGVLTATEGERWTVPPLVVRGATSHVGRIVLDVPRDLRLERLAADGVRGVSNTAPLPVDEPQSLLDEPMPPTVPAASPSRRIAFDYWREDFTLDVATHVKSHSYGANQNTIVTLYDDRLDLLAPITATGRFGTTFEVTYELPADWEVTRVVAGGVDVAWEDVPREAGTRTIRVPLPAPLPRGASTEVQLHARLVPAIWPPSVAPVEIPLPEVRLDASTVEATYVVLSPDWFEVTPLDTKGLDPVPAADDPDSDRRTGSRRLAFSYQNGRISGNLRIAPRPVRAAVRTLAFTRLDEDALRTHLEMQVQLTGAGRQDWVVSLPEELGTRVRFTSPDGSVRIVEQTDAPPQGGRIAWTLRFDRRVRGTVLLAVSGETAADGLLDVPLPDFPGAERHHGYVAVEANDRQRMTVSSAHGPHDEPLWQVDPVELPTGASYAPRERVVSVHRFVLPRSRVRLAETRFDRVPVPTAIGRSMTIATVLGRAGHAEHRMTATVATSGVQSLGLNLPEGAEIWSATVDEEAVELRNVDGVHVVQWPAADGTGSVDRQLDVHYATPLDRLGRFEQRPPGLALRSTDRRWSAVDVLNREWIVHYPTGTALVASDGAFHPTEPLDPASLLGTVRSTIEAVRPHRLAGRGTVLLVFLAVLFLATVAAQRWGTAGVFGSIAISGAALLLFALTGGFGGGQLQETSARYDSAKKSDQSMHEWDDEESAEWGEFSFTPGSGLGGLAGGLAGGIGGGLGGDSAMNQLSPSRTVTTIETPKFDDEKADEAPKPEPTLDPAAPPAVVLPGDDDLIGNLERKREIATQQAETRIDRVLQSRSREVDPEVAAAMIRATLRQLENDADVDPAARERFAQRLLIAQREIENQGDLFDQRNDQRAERVATLEAEAGARLSVPIAFEEADGRSRRFRYGGADDAAVLSVGLASVQELWAWRCFVAAVVVIVLWFLRKGSAVQRALLATTLLVVAIGAVGLVPARLGVTCDGLLLGTFVGIGLWCVAAVCEWFARMKPYAIPAAKTVLLIGLAGATSSAWAEDPERPAKPSVPPVPDAEDWTVIVPYADEADPLGGDRVFVPRETFAKLWNLAHPEDPVDALELPAAVVSAVAYGTKLEPGGDGVPPRVAVTATFTLHTFETGSRVTLPVGRAATRSLTLDGNPTAIVPANGGLAIIVPAAGRHTVVVGYTVPARVTGPAGRFTLDVANVPAGRLEFPLPAADLRVRVDGAANTYRLEPGDAPRIVVPIAKGGATTIEWRPESETDAGDANVLVETTTAVHVSDLGVLATSAFRSLSRGAGITELSFAVPNDVRVRRILGEDVGGWSFDGEGDTRTLAVFLRRTVTDETTIVIEVFREAATNAAMQGTVPVPIVSPREVTRETGRLAVHADAHLDVRANDLAGLRRTESFGEVAAFALPSAPERFSYRFVAPPIAASLDISRRRPEVRVEALHTVHVGRHDARHEARFAYDLGDTPRQRLTVRLPTDYVPLEVVVAGLDDWYVREDGDRTLVVEFTEARNGSAVLVVEGETPIAGNAANLVIDVPTPTDVERTTSQVGLFAADGLRVRVEELGGWKRVPADRVDGRLRAIGSQRPTATLASEEVAPEPVTAVVRSDVPNWTGGDALHLVTVDDAQVSSNLLLRWRYDAAATDVFAFTLPDAYAGRVEVLQPPLRRIEEASINGGRTRWTLHAERPIRGAFLVALQVVSPPVGDELTAPVPLLEYPVAGPDGEGFAALDVQNRYVVAVNESRRQLASRASDDLDPVAVRDIPFLAEQGYEARFARATTLARLRTTDVVPRWEATTLARTRGASAAVRLADLTTVVGTEGTWRGRAVYTIENLGRQFLALDFPEDVRPIAATVRGVAKPIVAGGKERRFLIPIPLSARSADEAAFEVTVLFAGSRSLGGLQGPLGVLESVLEPVAPRVVSPNEDADFGIPVSRTRWTVHLPEGYSARPVEDDRNTFAAERSEKPLRGTASKSGGFPGGTSKGFKSRSDTAVAVEQDEQLKELFRLNVDAAQLAAPGKDAEKDRTAGFQREAFPESPDSPDDRPTDGKPGSRAPGGEQSGRPGEFDSRGERRRAAQEQSLRHEELIRDLNDVVRNQKDLRADTERGPANASKIMGEEAPPGFGPGENLSDDGRAVREPESGLVDLDVTVAEGTLSLDVDLPTHGRSFVFTKTGGDPRLAIAVWSDESEGNAYGLGWAVLWVGLGVAAFVVAARSPAALGWFLPVVAAVLGAFAFLLLDDDAAVCGFVVFVVGAIATCVACTRCCGGRGVA